MIFGGEEDYVCLSKPKVTSTILTCKLKRRIKHPFGASLSRP